MRRILLLVCTGLFGHLLSCHSGAQRPLSIKDLEESMLDLKIYQENLGDHLWQNRLEDADWLLEGMDSILHELNRKFGQHRKLQDPFSYHYKDRMREPVGEIRRGIARRDSARALRGYRLLVRNCNRCHTDHDITKQVKF